MEEENKKVEPERDMLKPKLTEQQVKDIAFNLWTGKYNENKEANSENSQEKPNITR